MDKKEISSPKKVGTASIFDSDFIKILNDEKQ
jgi:hypothetical protein